MSTDTETSPLQTNAHDIPSTSNSVITNRRNETRPPSSDGVQLSNLSLHITGFLKEDEEGEDPPVAPAHHPHHIALTRNKTKISHDGKSYEAHTVNLYQESLSKVISDLMYRNFTDYDEFAVAVLLNICQGLKNLHTQGKYLGEFTEDDIIFSCDKSSVVTIEKNTTFENATQQEDMRCLAKVFYFVLTEGSRLPRDFTGTEVPSNLLKFREIDLAKDVIESILEFSGESNPDGVRIIEILDHPIFWDDLQKINYICDAFDLIKEGDDKSRRELDKQASSVVGEDWFEVLDLKTHERTKIERNMKQSKNEPPARAIQKGFIRTHAQNKCGNSFRLHVYDEKSKSKFSLLKKLNWENFERNEVTEKNVTDAAQKYFDGAEIIVSGMFVVKKTENTKKQAKPKNPSFYELMQYIRDRQCHFHEGDRRLRLCFQNQTSGFWKFFSSRFPKLLWFIFSERENLFNGLRSNGTQRELDGQSIIKAQNGPTVQHKQHMANSLNAHQYQLSHASVNGC